MELNISPIDNRYKHKCDLLREYVSDFGFNKIRYEVELKYFAFLLKLIYNKNVSFNHLIDEFSVSDLKSIREIESKTNHDVKSIEYFIKNQLVENNKFNDLVKYKELIHFALSSQDINSVANTILLKRSIEMVIIPKIKNIISKLEEYSIKWEKSVMMSKTHGQPAVTTSMGKEIKVFNERLKRQLTLLTKFNYTTKFGGAVGNLNAHYFCYDKINWDNRFNDFLIENFDLTRNRYTTQIDHYDNFSEIFDIIKRINIILIDLNQDFWTYISQNYFIFEKKDKEVGSSTMPHKINPINFENAEGNLLYTNSILEFFSRKLPISRLQRDLTDSTVLRNIGVVFGHIELSFNNIRKGLQKLIINNTEITKDLNNNQMIISEAIQIILKKYGYKNSYEKMKEFTRKNEQINKEMINLFVLSLDVKQEIKEKIINLNVEDYI